MNDDSTFYSYVEFKNTFKSLDIEKVENDLNREMRRFYEDNVSVSLTDEKNGVRLRYIW